MCRYTALNRSVWEQVETLVYFFLFPVLLFQSIVRSPLDVHAASRLIGAGWALGLSGIAPYFIDAEAGPDPEALPIGGLTVVRFRNTHLAYAATWFALAALWAGWLIYLRRSRKAAD